VLGDCATCGGPALAYTGASTTSRGKYLCAGCTSKQKDLAKAKKPAAVKSRTPRRDYPEPAAVDGARWLDLGDNRWALVDASDFAKASVKNWFFFGGFAARREQWGGKVRHDYLHRFVLGLEADPEAKAKNVVEFIDQNHLNCRKLNLQITKNSSR